MLLVTLSHIYEVSKGINLQAISMAITLVGAYNIFKKLFELQLMIEAGHLVTSFEDLEENC